MAEIVAANALPRHVLSWPVLVIRRRQPGRATRRPHRGPSPRPPRRRAGGPPVGSAFPGAHAVQYTVGGGFTEANGITDRAILSIARS